MELRLNLEIENLYGGDGNVRYVEERSVKLTRTKSKKYTKQNTGVSNENLTGEEQSEVKQKDIQTFKLEDGHPCYRLGGIHGKLWGHMRAAGKMLADIGVEGFDSKAFVDRMMTSINITPINVVIKDHKPMSVAEIPQITAGMNKAMMIQKFDYLPLCKVDLKLSFPEMYKDRVLAILKQSEDMAGMNKRRATLKVLNRDIFGKGA